MIADVSGSSLDGHRIETRQPRHEYRHGVSHLPDILMTAELCQNGPRVNVDTTRHTTLLCSNAVKGVPACICLREVLYCVRNRHYQP